MLSTDTDKRQTTLFYHLSNSDFGGQHTYSFRFRLPAGFSVLERTIKENLKALKKWQLVDGETSIRN